MIVVCCFSCLLRKHVCCDLLPEARNQQPRSTVLVFSTIGLSSCALHDALLMFCLLATTSASQPATPSAAPAATSARTTSRPNCATTTTATPTPSSSCTTSATTTKGISRTVWQPSHRSVRCRQCTRTCPATNSRSRCVPAHWHRCPATASAASPCVEFAGSESVSVAFVVVVAKAKFAAATSIGTRSLFSIETVCEFILTFYFWYSSTLHLPCAVCCCEVSDSTFVILHRVCLHLVLRLVPVTCSYSSES